MGVIACGPQAPEPAAEDLLGPIPTPAADAPSAPFPGPLLHAAAVRTRFAEAETMRDLFRVTRFLKLDGPTVRYISKIRVFGGHIYLLDQTEGVVHQYTEEGVYVRQIGRKGEGPGEYVRAVNMDVVWGTHIGITDGERRFMLIYDTEGNLVRETPRPGSPGDAGRFPLGNQVIWNQPDRMYLADFRVPDGRPPHHVVLDLTVPGGKTLFGFGKRDPAFEAYVAREHRGRQIYTGFQQIGEKIWAADPGAAHIDIYTLEGVHLGRVYGPHENNMTLADYANLKPNPGGIVFIRKHQNSELIPFGDLVIQVMGGMPRGHLNLYDRNGNLLRHTLPRAISTYKTAANDMIYAVLNHYDDLEAYDKLLTEEEMVLLREAGWDPETYLEDNEYLCLWEKTWEEATP